MRKVLLTLLTLTLTVSLFAQDDDWRNRRDDRRSYRDTPADNAFEITPHIGWRWGGTIFARQNFLFTEDVDVEPSPSIGASVGIPIGDNGFKLELLANRQSSDLTTDDGLFEPDDEIAEIDVTYLHAGLQIPFARSRNASPYFVVSAGLANLDPQLRGVSAEQRFSASAGIGVKIPMNRSLSFRFEGRGFYTALEEEDEDCTICDNFYNEDFFQSEVNAGLVFSF